MENHHSPRTVNRQLPPSPSFFLFALLCQFFYQNTREKNESSIETIHFKNQKTNRFMILSPVRDSTGGQTLVKSYLI